MTNTLYVKQKPNIEEFRFYVYDVFEVDTIQFQQSDEYKLMEDNKELYWIIDKKTNVVLGPLLRKEFSQQRRNIKVSVDLKIK